MRVVGIVAFGVFVCVSALGADQQAPVFRGGVSGAAPVREVTNAVRPPDPRLFVLLLDDLSIPPSGL
jgi:hypothetical protein